MHEILQKHVYIYKRGFGEKAAYVLIDSDFSGRAAVGQDFGRYDQRGWVACDERQKEEGHKFWYNAYWKTEPHIPHFDFQNRVIPLLTIFEYNYNFYYLYLSIFSAEHPHIFGQRNSDNICLIKKSTECKILKLKILNKFK